MEKVRPPEVLDWLDAVMGTVVVIGGSVLGTFLFGVLAYW